jgi:hypothetical protein
MKNPMLLFQDFFDTEMIKRIQECIEIVELCSNTEQAVRHLKNYKRVAYKTLTGKELEK